MNYALMKKLAITPAWSGSKGLKDKNIIPLCGKWDALAELLIKQKGRQG